MEWPTVAAVKSALGVTTDARDGLIAVALQAAIEQVGIDAGYRGVTLAESSDPDPLYSISGYYALDDAGDPDVIDPIEPTASLSQAALILAVMAVKAPDAPFGVAAVFDTGGLRVAAQHPTYLKLLTGHRVAFGVG